jgi:meso-butanediol dehydrogenase/(S,S)-butanediol dehydrogenase/diacetyl reductase
MKRFDDKIALVTGAASGIGRATAIRLAGEGAQVLCADRNLSGASETAATIGAAATAWLLDVADPASCDAAVAETVRRWGRIDLLANVAGIGGFGHAAEIDDATWQRLIAINLTGVFQMTRAALPHLEAVRGNVVNIASAAGLVGVPYGVAYAASKSGVVGLTKSIAVEYASRQVRVNAICPGAVDTPLIAGGFDAITGVEARLFERLTPLLGPAAQPEDIAAAVAYLGSDEARFVTGAILAVDGGQTAA